MWSTWLPAPHHLPLWSIVLRQRHSCYALRHVRRGRYLGPDLPVSKNGIFYDYFATKTAFCEFAINLSTIDLRENAGSQHCDFLGRGVACMPVIDSLCYSAVPVLQVSRLHWSSGSCTDVWETLILFSDRCLEAGLFSYTDIHYTAMIQWGSPPNFGPCLLRPIPPYHVSWSIQIQLPYRSIMEIYGTWP